MSPLYVLAAVAAKETSPLPILGAPRGLVTPPPGRVVILHLPV